MVQGLLVLHQSTTMVKIYKAQNSLQEQKHANYPNSCHLIGKQDKELVDKYSRVELSLKDVFLKEYYLLLLESHHDEILMFV